MNIVKSLFGISLLFLVFVWHLSAPGVNEQRDIYILKSLSAVRTPHTVFTFVFMLLCYKCTLMPSSHNRKYIFWTMHLYMFHCPKDLQSAVNIVCVSAFVNYKNIGSDKMQLNSVDISSINTSKLHHNAGPCVCRCLYPSSFVLCGSVWNSVEFFVVWFQKVLQSKNEK